MHCAKCFIVVTLFNPDNNLRRWPYFLCFIDEKTEVEFKYFTQVHVSEKPGWEVHDPPMPITTAFAALLVIYTISYRP